MGSGGISWEALGFAYVKIQKEGLLKIEKNLKFLNQIWMKIGSRSIFPNSYRVIYRCVTFINENSRVYQREKVRF